MHEYVKAYTNCGFIIKEGFGFQDGLFTGYNEELRDYDKSTWEYEIGPGRLREGRPDPTAPALCHAAAANSTSSAIHAGTGGADLRLAKGLNFSRSANWLQRTSGARPHHVVALCARLDASQQGLAEHPRDDHRANVARQYRHARWRDERVARPFQHPGPDRSGADEQSVAGLYEPAVRTREPTLAELHEHEAFQAASARVRPAIGKITANSSSRFRRLSTARPRRQGQRLGLTTTSPSSTYPPTTCSARSRWRPRTARSTAMSSRASIR